MKTFVLVHGAWHGSWTWERFTPLLEKEGHQVFVIELSYGIDISLSQHITELCEFVVKNNLTNIILVGHSYGGMVISGTATIIFDRISQLVYMGFPAYPAQTGHEF